MTKPPTAIVFSVSGLEATVLEDTKPPPVPDPGSVPYDAQGLEGVTLHWSVWPFAPRLADGPSQGDLALCAIERDPWSFTISHLRHDGTCWRVMPVDWFPLELPKYYAEGRQAYLDFLSERLAIVVHAEAP